MEASRKGTAPAPSTKTTSASLDEDFGKDFLSSWNSTKFGNDAMDFDVGTSEGKGKKFNFGKLDDFDLDADFDKLPAFKMDMSLDFSSPIKKKGSKVPNEKSLNGSSHGKDKENDSFSFSFNFDDLGKFDLDTDLTSKDKKAAHLEPSTSVELGISKTQKIDLPTENLVIPKIDLTKASSSKPETSSSTSRPSSTEKHSTKLPSYDLSKGSMSGSGLSAKYREAQGTQLHSVKGNSDGKTDISSGQSLENHPQMMTSTKVVTSSNNQDNNSAALSAQNEPKRNSVGAAKEVGVENGTDSTGTISSTQRQLKLNMGQERETSSLICRPQPNSALTSEQPGDLNTRTKLLNSDLQAKERALKNTIGCVPTGNASSKCEKQTSMTNALSSRLTKMNQISPSAKSENDLKSGRLTPVLPNLASRGKPALISPPLKRKAVEDSVSDLFTPLKRISGPVAESRTSPTVALKLICNSPLEARKSPEIAIRSDTEMVSRSENAEASKDNLKSESQTVLSIADLEIPVLALENNENVEKAESISKELGDIRSMLKKKQEEAKQLLVRAIVSNNKLLMLNHPMYAEKLSDLERFASTLRTKYF